MPPSADPATVVDRAAGALWGLAIGDALGMPTQMLSRAEIVARWGPVVPWFEPADPGHPMAAGLPAGHVTDDTEQAVLLAHLLVSGHGQVSPLQLAAALEAWEADMRARGSADLLGPSTKRALDAVRAGIPVGEAGRHGDTNGAAMRIAPLGIAAPVTDLQRLVDRVVEVSSLTHGTRIGLAGAAAVCAAVSAGIGGAAPDAVRETAIDAARLAARRGVWVAGADVAARIGWASDLVRGLALEDALDRIGTLVGTSLATQESVPAAFAVVSLFPADPWAVTRVAASLGGDTDTIGAIAGAIAGAATGRSRFPAEAVRVVGEVNGLDIDPLAVALLSLRRADGEAP
jgi:ADP-ribosylglycohydrolase